jgi:erythromycin esterase
MGWALWALPAGAQVVATSTDSVREEIHALYAKIESAYRVGDFEVLRVLAAPEARFGHAMRPSSVGDVIEEMKANSAGAATISSRTEIVLIDVAGDQAKLRCRTLVTTSIGGTSTAREIVSDDLWERGGGTWRLKESFATTGRELLPPTDPKTAAPVVGAIKKRAVPILAVVAGQPYIDLRAFGRAVGEARVVSLGEATHGTREIFQLKHRLIEYLIRAKGFTVLAFESNWPESEAVDRYIKTGQGDPRAALGELQFWPWQTDEVLALLEWMRAFNMAPGSHPILSFTSFDMQSSQGARTRVLGYVRSFAPGILPELESAYSSLAAAIKSQSRDYAAFDSAARSADAVVALLDSRRSELTRVSGPSDYRNALQAARVVAQFAHARTASAGPDHRDRMMARNVEWLLNEAHSDQKIVLWAHNGHIATADRVSITPVLWDVRPMGYWLRALLGPRMYVLGFAVHTGEVRAVTLENGKPIGLALSTIPKADPGTGTEVLSAAGIPSFFLDFRNTPALLAEWLAAPHLFRNIGAVWDRDHPEAFMVRDTLAKSYDGIVYLESTHAARGTIPPK